VLTIDVVSTGVTEALIRLNAKATRLSDLSPELEKATELVYSATRAWYDSDGGGRWPPLAASTIRSKQHRGSASPERPLYDTGKLYESATSPSGPYSFKMWTGLNAVVIGVDWERGGWQIPVVHFYGTHTAGRGHSTTIPARPIWPDHDSMEYLTMRESLTELMLRGL
jgi:hypothetical protein